MEDRFYIVLGEDEIVGRYANKRNAKLEAGDLTIKDPKTKHFVFEAICVAEPSPPVTVSDIKSAAEPAAD